MTCWGAMHFVTWLVERNESGAPISSAFALGTVHQVPSYLEQVIVPAYHTVASELADVGHGVIDHSKVCNYDDFNEIFWQSSCLDLNINTMFEGKTMKRRCGDPVKASVVVHRQRWSPLPLLEAGEVLVSWAGGVITFCCNLL